MSFNDFYQIYFIYLYKYLFLHHKKLFKFLFVENILHLKPTYYDNGFLFQNFQYFFINRYVFSSYDITTIFEIV